MDLDILLQYAPILLSGFKLTILCWVLGTIFGMALGLIIALLQRYGPRSLGLLLRASIEIIRGTPFLVQHVTAIERAIRDGADVRGYAHWSLMDNFEWAEGYDAQFGLFSIEKTTLRRVPTEAVEPFRNIGANIPR